MHPLMHPFHLWETAFEVTERRAVALHIKREYHRIYNNGVFISTLGIRGCSDVAAVN